MGKYRITVKIYSFANIIVEAKDEQTAIKNIDNRPTDMTVYDGNYREILGVEKIIK